MAQPQTDIALLPEFRDNPFINRLPPQLSQRDAWRFLSDPPEFRAEERTYPIHIRVNCLYRLRRFFEPLEHHLRLESAFSSLLRQGYVSRNPLKTDYIRRLQDGHERIIARDLKAGRHYVRGTAEGFALLGASGAGKSTAISRILEYYPQVIEHHEPFSLQQVVWLKLDCPHQGSPKQLCMHFFQELDMAVGTRSFAQFGKTRHPVDLMMVQMAQLANRHALGVLVIDEIQHLTLAKGGGQEAMLNFLVTLVNTIGIPVITIGTMGALPLFQGDFRQARRANGLGCAVWERLQPGSVWNHFVDVLWKHQWTRQESLLTDEIRHVLYEESQGVIDVLVKLFMLAQLQVMEQNSFRNTPEVMDAQLFREAAARHFKLVEPMIRALKTNNEREISKYDDLRPLESLVRQLFQDAMLRSEPFPLPALAPKAEADRDGAPDALVGALMQAGVAEDIAALMATKARTLHPGASVLELIGHVSGLLQDRGPETLKKTKRAQRKDKPQGPPVSLLSDIAEKGREAGQSAEESLTAAGLVRPPRFGST
jgi:hypothetical protein